MLPNNTGGIKIGNGVYASGGAGASPVPKAPGTPGKTPAVIKLISNFISNKKATPQTIAPNSFAVKGQQAPKPAPAMPARVDVRKEFWESKDTLPTTSKGIPITQEYLTNLASNTFNLMPKSQIGTIPALASSIRYGDNLYYDLKRNELTSESNSNTKQLFQGYDTNGQPSWVFDGQRPVMLDEENVVGLYSLYNAKMKEYNPQRIPTGFPKENLDGLYTIKQLSKIVPQDVINALKSTWSVKRGDTFYIIPRDKLAQLSNPSLTEQEKSEILKSVQPYNFGVPKNGKKGFNLSVGEGQALFGEITASMVERHNPVGLIAQDLLATISNFAKGVLSLNDFEKDTATKFAAQKLTDDIANVMSGADYYDSYTNTIVNPDTITAHRASINEETMAKEFEYVAIQATPKHNEAKRLAKLGDIDSYMKAIDILKESYNTEFSSYTRDPSFNGTQYYDPTYRDKLFTTMAQIELQHGMPLTRNEIRTLAYDMADPMIDFIWGIGGDFTNLGNLPVGGIITGLLGDASPVVKTMNKLIPGFKNAQLDDGAVRFAYNQVVKPGAGVAYDVFKASPPGKLLIDVWHLDNILKESTASVARKVGQQADNISRFMLGQDLPRLENVTEAGLRLNKYGNFIKGSELTGDELVSAVVDFAKANGDNELADIHIAKKLISFTDAVDPSGNGWGKLFVKQYDNAVDDLYKFKLAEGLNERSVRKQMVEFATAGNEEAALDLRKLIDTKARVFAEMNVKPEQVGRRIGGVFHESYKEGHRAWEGTKILENTLFGWLGNIPGMEGIRASLNNWDSGVQSLYRNMFTGLVNNWLYRSGRWLSYNQMENLATYALFKTDKSFASRIFDYATVVDDVDTASFKAADDLAEMRFGFAGELKQEGIRSYMKDHPLGHTTVSWGQHFLSAFKDGNAKFIADMAAEGVEPTVLRKVGHSISNVFESWKNAGRNLGGIMETVGRTRVTSTLIDENMRLVDDVVRAQTLGGAVTRMTAAGMSPESIQAMNELIDTAWKRSYGDPVKFKSLLDFDGIFKGNAPSASFWIPQDVLDKASPEDLEFLRQVNEEWTKHVNDLVSKKQYVRSQEVQAFKKSILEKIDALSKEVLNDEGVVGSAVLASREGKPALTKDLSDLLNDFEGAGFDVEKMATPPAPSNFRTIDTQQLLDADASGIENSKYVTKATVASAEVPAKLRWTQEGKRVLMEDNWIQYTDDVAADLKKLRDKLNTVAESKYKSSKDVRKILNIHKDILESADIPVKGRKTQDILDDLHRLSRPEVLNHGNDTWTKIITDLDKNLSSYPPEVVTARLWNERTRLIQEGVIPDLEHYLTITDDNEKILYIQKLAKSELGIDMPDDIALATMRDIDDVKKTGALSELTKASEYEANERGQLRALQGKLGAMGDSRDVTLEHVQKAIGDNSSRVTRTLDTVYPNRSLRKADLLLDRTQYEVRTEAERLAMNMKTAYRNAEGDFLRNARLAVEEGRPIPNVNKLDMLERAGFRNFVFDKETGDIISVDIYDPIENIYITTLGQTETGITKKTSDRPIFAELKRTLDLNSAEDLNAPFLEVNAYNKHIAPVENLRVADDELGALKPKATGYQKIEIKPVEGEAIEVTVAKERKNFIDGILGNEQWGDRTPKYFVDRILTNNLPKGKTVESLSPEEIVSELRRVAKVRKEEGITEISKTIDELADKIQYDIEQFNNFIDASDSKIIPPPITLNRLPDDLRTWAIYKHTHASDYEETRGLLDMWFESVGKQADEGTLLKTYKIASDNKATMKTVVGDAVANMTSMKQSVLYGGETGGVLLEGAVPKMQSAMKEYSTNVTNMDEFIKGIFPFWMFPSRATMAWSRMIAENPLILTFYNRYVRYSRSTQIQNGVVDSKGRPLPSFAGRVPAKILGRDMWVDLSAAAPIRYLFPSMRERSYYEDESTDKGILEEMMDNFSGQLTLRGIRWSPFYDIVYRGVKDQKDPYTGFNAFENAGYTVLESILPLPIEIIPPSFMNWIEQGMRKYAFPGLADMFDPHVSWRNSLVEESILAELLNDVQSATTLEEKRELVRKVQELFTNTDRTQDPSWIEHQTKMENRDFLKTSLPGFLTGFYPRYFTDDKANMYSIRNHNNFLRDSINKELGSVVFSLFPDVTDRYNQWSDKRYNTPEGWVWGLRNNLQFVKDPITGEIIQDEQGRLNEISRQTAVDIETEDYYAEMASARKTMSTEQQMCPLGDKDCQNSAYRKFQATAIELENKYPNIDSVWTEGIKPTVMKEDHYAGIWWKIIKATRPQRDMDNNEAWKDYKKRETEWLNNLPEIAAQQLPLFTTNMYAWGQKSTTVTPEFITTLAQSTTKEGLDAWDASHDTLIEGIERAYEDLRLSPYLDITDGLSINQRKMVEAQFLKANPVLTFYEVQDYLRTIYGDKWTAKEIQQAMTLPDTEQARPQIAPDKQFEINPTANETLWNKAWDIMGWSMPGGSTKLKNAFVALGGWGDDYDRMFDAVGGARAVPYLGWETAGGFPAVVSLIEKAAQSIGLTAPTGTEINVRAQAETLNDNFKQLASTQFGEGYEDIINRYNGMSTAERSAFRKSFPDQYQIIGQYYDLKDSFAKQNPIWAQYYNPKSGGKYYGGGGRSYGGGGGGGGSGSSVNQGNGQVLTMGLRSQGDIISILAGNKLGSGGVPKWLPDSASPVLKARISGNVPLTAADIKYLKKLIETNPESASDIQEFIGQNSAPVEATVA